SEAATFRGGDVARILGAVRVTCTWGIGAEGWGAENGRSVNRAFGRGAPALPSTADGASPATRRAPHLQRCLTEAQNPAYRPSLGLFFRYLHHGYSLVSPPSALPRLLADRRDSSDVSTRATMSFANFRATLSRSSRSSWASFSAHSTNARFALSDSNVSS